MKMNGFYKRSSVALLPSPISTPSQSPYSCSLAPSLLRPLTSFPYHIPPSHGFPVHLSPCVLNTRLSMHVAPSQSLSDTSLSLFFCAFFRSQSSFSFPPSLTPSLCPAFVSCVYFFVSRHLLLFPSLCFCLIFLIS